MRPKLSPGPRPTGPRTCRQCPMTADVNPWTLNLAPAGRSWAPHPDLLGGYEARSLVIADSERMADRGPSLIAPNDAPMFVKALISAVRPGDLLECWVRTR